MTAVDTLSPEDAATYARWFDCLADPTRVRVLHAVATEPAGIAIGELAERVGIGQSTCSHHVAKLAEVGFVCRRRRGTATVVTVNDACCTGLPHAADVVMGTLAVRPCCGVTPPPNVRVRAMRARDFPAVRRIYQAGIDTGNATFETTVPAREVLEQRWLPGHRWVAELDGRVAGWSALTAASQRDCYRGVAETSIYVDEAARGGGVGTALLQRTVDAADSGGLWTLQTAIFPENRPSLALHRRVGFRTVGVRERIGRVGDRWRDTVLMERRRPD
jgi:L-amino acid N-acyltransferase YncA/DNA-binding transcriptional ArsR family regulator